jgi:hypothetical protein
MQTCKDVFKDRPPVVRLLLFLNRHWEQIIGENYRDVGFTSAVLGPQALRVILQPARPSCVDNLTPVVIQLTIPSCGILSWIEVSVFMRLRQAVVLLRILYYKIPPPCTILWQSRDRVIADHLAITLPPDDHRSLLYLLLWAQKTGQLAPRPALPTEIWMYIYSFVKHPPRYDMSFKCT